MNPRVLSSADPAQTYLRSSFFEKLVEHVFISEVLQEAWYGCGKVVEVLRSEVDSSGFDVVFECEGVVRHVQLKTSRPGSSAAAQKVNVALSAKPSGCVVWLMREEAADACRMRLTYRFFGSGVGQPLPTLEGFKVARHTKANAKGEKAFRPNVRVVPKSAFRDVGTTADLVTLLFGIRRIE